MQAQRRALQPLGSLRGEEALNSWEHISLSEWLDTHFLPGEEELERRKQALFEEEYLHWEEVTYKPLYSRSIWDSSELTELEEDTFSEPYNFFDR